MDNRIEKIQELARDETFIKELITKVTPEDTQLFYEEHGVEMTLDECSLIGQMIEKVKNGEIDKESLMKAADGELTEEELENVAGGELVMGIIAGVAFVALCVFEYFAYGGIL